jgi:hypothetical protein
MFNCPFCCFIDSKKISITRHLGNKKKCNKEVDLELYNKAIDYLKEQKYTFIKFPNEILDYKSYNKNKLNLDNIINYLNNNPDIKEKITKILTTETHDIFENNTNFNGDNNINGNNNNNTINNFTLVYNNFGEEKYDYISNETLAELCKAPYTACSKLLKLINFNKDHIENFTIKTFNERSKFIEIRKDNEWIKENKDVVIDQIIGKNNIILSNFINSFGNLYLEPKHINNFEQYLENVSDEKNPTYKRVSNDCLLCLINFSSKLSVKLCDYKENNGVLIPITNIV